MKPFKQRPFSVTLLTWIVLIMSVSNLVKFVQTTIQWNFLNQILPFSPFYLLVSGLTWGTVGLVISWGLWRGLDWAPVGMKLFLIVFTLYYWLDRILLNNPVSRETNQVFVLGLTILLWIWTFWLFARIEVKNFFGVLNE